MQEKPMTASIFALVQKFLGNLMGSLATPHI